MTTRQFQESSALRIFLSYFKPHRKLFFLDMCCALMIAVIDLAFPYVSRWCMYQLLPESAYRTFFAVMAVVFCAYILRSVFTYIICYYGHTFGILVEADIRRDLFRHMQELSFDYYDRNRTGQLMSRLTSDLFELTELAHHGPEDLFISLVTIIGALTVLTNIIVEVLKRATWEKMPTNLLAIIVAMVLTLVAFFGYMAFMGYAVMWYYVAAAVVVGFAVAYAAMFGFDKLKEALGQIKKNNE